MTVKHDPGCGVGSAPSSVCPFSFPLVSTLGFAILWAPQHLIRKFIVGAMKRIPLVVSVVLIFAPGHCQLGLCAGSVAEATPDSPNVLDLTSDFQENEWARASRLTPIWNRDGKTAVLISVNVLRAGRDYEILCELNSWNLLEHPFDEGISSRYRNGGGFVGGQFRGRGGESGGNQGALLLDFS